MELDELKQAWTHMELRQDGMEALLRADFRDRRMDRTRSILRWSLAGRVVELAIWIVFTVWVASFWVEHRDVTHWLVIGLLLHVYGIAAIWSNATQLLLLGRIYLFDAPVLVLQRRLAQLRRFRFYSTLLLGLPWWCLWLLVTAVGAQWLFGMDIYAMANPAWFWAALGVGVAGIGFSLWLARRLAGRPLKSPLLHDMVENMSGRSLLRASRELDDIARFERD